MGYDAKGTGVPASRARGRPKVRSDEESRALVVASAFELFLELGYGATSTNAIAERCGISKRTFYRLFPGKVDLFAATVAHHRRLMTVFPPHDPEIPMEEQLATVFRVDIDEAEDHRRTEFIRMAVDESRHYPELVQIVGAEGAKRSQRELADWLEEGKAKGLLDIGDPLATARILMDLIFGAAALKTGHGTEWPGGPDRPGFMRSCIRLVVNGIRAR
ncbi:TetR/AcrR family transcriptional regulator [Ensifer sp. BR816]|uniref:TetR/AcrR family transcriptional regulator n=1 Tax=Rhizobium sp. (strain BR816) TaxID=1057002 RepID=UPI00035FADFB|nr:TetR/AcrR family transcriptional regulator [Ensifer sp. BR816]